MKGFEWEVFDSVFGCEQGKVGVGYVAGIFLQQQAGIGVYLR